VILLLARASSTPVEMVWYLIIFANISVFGVVMSQEERIGGGKVLKSVLSPKMVRRMSTTVAMRTVGSSEAMMINNNHPTTEESNSSSEEEVLLLGPLVVKPKAGTTSIQIENPEDVPIKDGHIFAGWRVQDPGIMMIRSHNYMMDKKKTCSPGELYQCVHVDIFESRQRYPNMASRAELPTVHFTDDDEGGGGGGPKTWNAPDIFVVSISIPTDPPKPFCHTEDGGGYTITAYFVMHQETRDILKRVTSSERYPPNTDHQQGCDDRDMSKVNAVRLWEEWCTRSPTDDTFCARFKVIPNVQNLTEIGLPTWISRYNGKPFLIKRPGQTGFLYRHPEKSCIEFDISLHPFPFLAKQGILFMKDSYFHKILVSFGFLIEGRSEDELPECLIGLTQLCYPNPIHAIQGEDFMTGTSPRSFD